MSLFVAKFYKEMNDNMVINESRVMMVNAKLNTIPFLPDGIPRQISLLSKSQA